jgi:hypothetical protein
MPGFVGGYWWNAPSGEGWGLRLYETEEAANAAAAMAGSNAMPMPDCVTTGGAPQVVRIVAQA